jgi:hypothetical protein
VVRLSLSEMNMYAISRLDDQIVGLKYRPSIEPGRSDDADFYEEFYRPVPREFSRANQEVLRQALLGVRDLRCIVEIGVQRNPLSESSTGILLRHKPADAVYIGVDIEDKSHLTDTPRGIYTIKTDSAEHSRIFTLMDRLRLQHIDFLFIDGWHSVNQCVADWKYVERLSPEGVVVLHDTNVHPGPVVLFEAIDEDLFEKKRLCTEGPDWGIAVITKI